VQLEEDQLKNPHPLNLPSHQENPLLTKSPNQQGADVILLVAQELLEEAKIVQPKEEIVE